MIERRRLTMREGTCDQLVFDEVWVEDVYQLFANRALFADLPALDLGANVGAFTLRALDLGASRVVAVEPHPENIGQLNRNVAAVDQSGVVTLHAAAVVGVNGPKQLDLIGGDERYENITWQARDSDDVSSTLTVPTVQLNKLLAAEPLWGVLKCDIEGAEYATFEGADPELMSRVRFITMEFHGPGMGQHCAWIEGGSLGRLVELLSETHHVRTLGAASRGGQLYAWSY